jgi:hypothetical protein
MKHILVIKHFNAPYMLLCDTLWRLIIEIRLYDFRCRLRDNGVTRSAQYAHSIGYPISQREKRGFSWDGAIFSVSAVDGF